MGVQSVKVFGVDPSESQRVAVERKSVPRVEDSHSVCSNAEKVAELHGRSCMHDSLELGCFGFCDLMEFADYGS